MPEVQKDQQEDYSKMTLATAPPHLANVARIMAQIYFREEKKERERLKAELELRRNQRKGEIHE